MAKFFIDRPVFAMVIAIVIVLIGAVTIPNLPVAAYPQVVPPVVQITANYRGGNSLDLEKTVAQPIEQQLTGLDGMMYFFSRSSNDGLLTIDVTFELGTDVDLATVKTQNKVSLALPLLPAEVQREGVSVKKVSTAFLTVIALTSPDGRYDSLFLNNYAAINLLDKVGSIDGVGDSRLGAGQIYGMRVWVDPDKMAKLKLTATDVSNAIQAQNRQNPAGALGQPPSPHGVDFQYPVNAQGRLLDASQFGDIVLRAQPDGSLLRLKDVGRVELGAQSYSNFGRLNGSSGCLLITYLAPGANAVDTANRIYAFMETAKKSFPAGMEYSIPYDTTRFVRAAVQDVVKTLLIAVGLVIIVVFIFLQNLRATLIPLVTVPVSLLGALALFPMLGFSINMTTMFGLVLAIGIVVDDAIVVVEAVQHNLDHGYSPREATIKAMSEVSGPVIAIACILSAVFIPVAFLGGISGQIYRQFALTIAASVLISAFSALSLSPALSAMLLRPKGNSRGIAARLFNGFNIGFDWTVSKYLGGVRVLLRRSALAILALLVSFAGTFGLFRTLPRGFLPDEDQGVIICTLRLPDGASLERTEAAVKKVEDVLRETPSVVDIIAFGGLDALNSTNSSNAATLFAALKHWDERKGPEEQLPALLASVNRRLSQIPEGVAVAFGQAPIQGLSNTAGFELMLEDRVGGDTQQLADAAQAVIDAARARPEIANISSSFRSSVPQYRIDLDTDKAQTLGVPVTDVYNALQTFLGGLYVNDFNRFSRTWRVLVQADPQYRDNPDDVNRFYVRSAGGDMVPLSTLVKVTRVSGPEIIFRYNRFRATKLNGQTPPGYSTGQTADAIQEVADQTLPQGFATEWTGTVFQQKLSEGKEPLLFGFATVLVFLFLAALYESWRIPLVVIFAVPLGLLGALLAVYVRSYAYDIYTQIGIVTLIGLAAKNAILIVEYARLRRHEGMSIDEAALNAAQLRLRPILMTSFAFILGVVPLLVATGAGASSRRALGTAVFGGMNAATLLAVFIVPVLFAVAERIVARRTKAKGATEPAEVSVR
jgi:hydrophobe/amphiphile efflux-1 (HAE1) family protein